MSATQAKERTRNGGTVKSSEEVNPNNGALRKVEYTPLGERDAIHLTIPMVREMLTNSTKSGKQASDADVTKFIMMCKSKRLNPWTGDAYLLGYDSKEGPSFSLITAIQALFKRAESNPEFDGIESGVIVTKKGDKSGELIYRDGDFLLPTEVLVGGWARCHRKDRKIPFYDALNLNVFERQTSQWRKDPAGMLVKCAEASVLRKAFPTEVGGLYIADEWGESHQDAKATVIPQDTSTLETRIVDGPSRQEPEEEPQAEEPPRHEDGGPVATPEQEEANGLLLGPNESPEKWERRLRDVIKEAEEPVDLYHIEEAVESMVEQQAIDEGMAQRIRNRMNKREAELSE